MTKNFSEGMGQAVAERTILRKKENNEWETWADVAKRVAEGNTALCKSEEERKQEYDILFKHISNANILMSGRHLQHGDETQPNRTMEVFTNCSAVPTSSSLFALLLSGSGVGCSYDDDIVFVDYRNCPEIICVLSKDHKDYDEKIHKSKDYGLTLYLQDNKNVLWHTVDDSREGWAKAFEYIEILSFEKEHKDKKVIVDFSNVRPYGAPIKGMQNRPASGPNAMMVAFQNINELRSKDFEPWKQKMYVDHYLAESVLFGGARRCLPEGYKILMANLSLKNIEDIVIGDKVMYKGNSYNVAETFKQGVQQILKIYTEDGRFHESSKNHKWLVHNNETGIEEWVIADNLDKGDYSFVNDSEHYNITMVLETDCKNTFDIEVETVHAFYAINPETGLKSISHNSARMATKYWKDESVLDFIVIKRPDEYSGLSMDEIIHFSEKHGYKPWGKLWTSNNSVTTDAEFWEYVNYEESDPRCEEPLVKHARKVFRMVAEASYGDGTGEPAFINVDKLTTKNEGIEAYFDGDYIGSSKYKVDYRIKPLLAQFAKTLATKKYPMITNPCISGNSIIQTNNGDIVMKELVKRYLSGETIFVNDGDGNFKPVIGADKTRIQADVLELIIEENGIQYKLVCTPDHRIFTTNRGWVMAKDLLETDDVKISV